MAVDAHGNPNFVIPQNGDGEVGIKKSGTFTPLDIPGLQNTLFAGVW